MDYQNCYNKLKEGLASNQTKIKIDEIEIHKLPFTSNSQNLLSGNKSYFCEKHQLNFEDTISYFNDIGTIESGVHIKDVFVKENQQFSYYILKPLGAKKVKKVTFLFHGLNEKNWEKYLPWGKAICEQTNSAIVFFPIAFHMERAPLSWSEKRKMFELSEQRKRKFPNAVNSSLSNVAISMRLHAMPQRMIWSGLQTYYDVIQFIENCKNDNHPLIDKDFDFNIFAYSIGGLLAEILKLSNYKNYFTNTKLCLFCSGAVVNRISPVSKFILDSEANIALYAYLAEHFNKFLEKDKLLHHYIEEDHIEGEVFNAMLEYQKKRNFREDLFKKVEHQVYAIALQKDIVIPPFEVMNTLQGAFRDINIKVDLMDFNYKYTHENPFPLKTVDQNLVNESFNFVFNKVSAFFNK